MRRATIGILLAVLAINMTGCSGCMSGTSQSEMLARSSKRKRPKIDEDELATVAGINKKKVAAAPDEPPASPAPVPPNTPAVAAIGGAATTSVSIPPPPPASAAPLAAVASAVAEPVVVVHSARPETPLTPEQARLKTAQNLAKISAALLAYVDRNGRLPASAVAAPAQSKKPGLSWRVELLPYLGYEPLYRQFHLNEPWDSQHNRSLLGQIPVEYQSPERFDEKTNYLAPLGSRTAFNRSRGRAPRAFESGAKNVLMLVEVDEARAVPWTEPEDLPFDPKKPNAGLGTLRGNGFFAVMADGVVVQVPSHLQSQQLANLFSINDGLNGASLVQPIPTSTVATASAAPSAESPPGAPPAPTTSAVAVSASLASSGIAQPAADNRLPVPDAAALKKSRKLLREVYADKHSAAKDAKSRLALAQEMFTAAGGAEQDAADQYELLRIAGELAASAGSIELALQTIDRLDQRFAIDGASLRVALLEDASKQIRDPASWPKLAQAARQQLHQAIENDQFDTAQRAAELYQRAARAGKDRHSGQQAGELLQSIKRMQDIYADVPQARSTLQREPLQPEANETVGKFYCFVKGKWDTGLPLLARAADVRLRGIAMVDLDPTKPPAAMLQLADEYSEMARQQEPPLDHGMKLRAAHYYAQASIQLPPGLERIKAQKRLDELRELFGRTWLDETLGIAPTVPAANADES